MRLALLAVLFVCLTAASTVTAQSPGYLGAASCAASTCHGGVTDKGPAWNHSFSTWYAKDPHAGAGLLLRDEDSRTIVERLNPDARNSPEIFDTMLRQRCISCHTTTTPTQCESTGLLDDALLAAGVSCESCHGSAQTWIDAHVRFEFTGPQRFKSEVGMNDTESIVGRAETCVRCHVGSRSSNGLIRDMNHDLIAAGHPALRFDLLLYQENLPKHWSTESENERRFLESSIRVRRVSRAINLAAAASLSSERASDHLDDPAVPWPELADYDCFACHQSLSMAQYLLPPGVKALRRSPLRVSDGLPIWNSWHSVGQKDLSKQQVEALSPSRADPRRLVSGAAKLAKEYRDKATILSGQSENPVRVLDQLREALQDAPPRDWHHAAVQYLQIDAAVRDLATKDVAGTSLEQWRESLRQMERSLRFDAQRSADQRSKFHSPADFDPERFRRDALKPLGESPATPSNSTNASGPTNQPQPNAP